MSSDLTSAFWSLWPGEAYTEKVEGYYTQVGSTSAWIEKTIHQYYSEFSFSSDVVMRFVPRDKSKIHGIYSGIRNDDGESGFDIDDTVVDALDVPLTSSAWTRPNYSETVAILHHDKYQGVCASNWDAL